MALVVFGLLGAEALLQMLAYTVPAIGDRLEGGKARYITDSRLGFRGDPALHDEYDAFGFRNAARPPAVDIVAIGDSQTEGEGVVRDDAWPQQLAKSTGRAVYQLAFGGYGPGQYEMLLDDALPLRPRVIVVGLYFGNDFADAYAWVYEAQHATELRTADPSEQQRLANAREAMPAISEAWRETRDAEHAVTSSLPHWLRYNAFKHAKLVGVYKRLRTMLMGVHAKAERLQQSDALASIAPDLLYPFILAESEASAGVTERGETLGTLLTPRARLAAMDTDDPRISEGLRITLELIAGMQHKCSGRTRLAVLLIPTKELVFGDKLTAQQADRPPDLAKLLSLEQSLRYQVKRELDAHGTQWIDPLPALRASLAGARNPYRSDSDGHPNSDGYAAIAAAVAAAVTATR